MRHLLSAALLLCIVAPASAGTYYSPDASLHLIVYRYGFMPFTEHASYVGELYAEELERGWRIWGDFEPAGGYDAEEPSLRTVFELPIAFDFGPGIESFTWGDEHPRVNPYLGPAFNGERIHAGLSGWIGPFLELHGHPPFERPDFGIAEGWLEAEVQPLQMPEPATAVLLLTGLLLARGSRPSAQRG